MDLHLARLAGARRPSAELLRAALEGEAWLAPAPGRRGVWLRSFTFDGGEIRLLTRPRDGSRYAAPRLQAELLPHADFAATASRIVPLAGKLGLGVDTSGSNGALWWPAPDPTSLEPGTSERAVEVSRACEGPEAWPLLGFALSGPECLELAESNPALAFLVANTARLDGRYRTDVPAGERALFHRDLARRPRRRILAALDFPATESMVHLLGKIPPDGLNLESLRLMRDLPLAPRAAKALRHLPRLGSGLVRLAVRPRLWRHVGPQLLSEASADADDAFVFFHLRDTVDMAAALGRLDDLGVVPSTAALVHLHDRLREDYESRPIRNLRAARRRQPTQGPGPDARPPVPVVLPPPRRPSPPQWFLGVEPPPHPPGLVPLRTPAELREEGREMQHCVASYEREVARREYWVYRVLEPERATLAVRWDKNRGAWLIDQLRGFKNRRVRPETRGVLRDWLETGEFNPRAVVWAREQARKRFHAIVEQLQQTSNATERKRLKEELARLRVSPTPTLGSSG